MQTEVTIIKNNHAGQEVWRYPGVLLQRSTRGLLFEAYFNRSELEFNGILLKEHDRFFEFYPFDKYYNIYTIYDRDDGRLKAWYCNVTRPIRHTEGSIEYDDLALDLLVYEDGRQLVLDREEFEALPLMEAERKSALQALEELQALFEENQPLDVFSLL
jgi:hypothetical protein